MGVRCPECGRQDTLGWWRVPGEWRGPPPLVPPRPRLACGHAPLTMDGGPGGRAASRSLQQRLHRHRSHSALHRRTVGDRRRPASPPTRPRPPRPPGTRRTSCAPNTASPTSSPTTGAASDSGRVTRTPRTGRAPCSTRSSRSAASAASGSAPATGTPTSTATSPTATSTSGTAPTTSSPTSRSTSSRWSSGYVAGFNQQLTDEGPNGWCEGEPWVGPITTTDLYANMNDVLLFASSGVLIDPIATAQPPPTTGVTTTPTPTPRQRPPAHCRAWACPPTWAATAGPSARPPARAVAGMLLANPHFPWEGEKRLWENQLTLTTGELNVYGVTLTGTPGVLIGFNDAVAWTHTVSAGLPHDALRTGPRPVEPDDLSATARDREMTSEDLTIEVRRATAHARQQTRTMWSSHYGPMLDLPFGWTDGEGVHLPRRQHRQHATSSPSSWAWSRAGAWTSSSTPTAPPTASHG